MPINGFSFLSIYSLAFCCLDFWSFYIGISGRPNEGQNNRKKNESVEQSKDYNKKENFEEHWEDMRVAPRKEDECKQGGEPSIEHCHAHVYYGCPSSLLPCAGHGEEGVADVDAVVHTEANGDDDVAGAHNVDGDVPGRHEATQVHQAESHREEDIDWAQDVGQEDQGGQEHAGKGNA